MQRSPRLEAVKTLLQRRGAPVAYMHRLMRELAEHREDLLRDLLREGMTPEQAEMEADRRMGEPAELASATIEKMRRVSLVGRHRVLWLVVMPVLFLPVSWFLLLGLAAWGTGMLSATYRVASIHASSLSWIYMTLALCRDVVPGAIGAGFYLLARRKFCGRIWSFVPALMAWAVSSILFVHIYPVGFGGAMGRMVIGIALHFDFVKTVVLIAVLLFLEVKQGRMGAFAFWRGRRDREAMLAKER